MTFNNLLPFCSRRQIYAALVLLALAVPSARAAAPSALVGVFSGASQNSAWFTGSSDPVDKGFHGPQSVKSGRIVWQEELQRFAPGMSVGVGSKVKAGVGFVSYWWTEAGGLTPEGAGVRDDLIARMKATPAAEGFVCHVLASAAYNEAPPERFRAELSGYARALHDAVEQAFGKDKRKFTFWWLAPGNRWGNPEGGQSTAALRRQQPWLLTGVAEGGSTSASSHARLDPGPGSATSIPASSAAELTFFRVAPATMAYVIGDWNASGDGIHYTRADNQRAGRQLAYSMLLDWGERPAGMTRELRVVSAARDPNDPNAILVRVQKNGGTLFAGVHPCRVSTADGKGIGVSNQGVLLDAEWTCTVDNKPAPEKVATVRLRHVKPLPDSPLFFSYTWGTWHTVSPGRPGYTGPLSVWHEAVGGSAGMTQDFADLTTAPRPVILTLGTAHLLPVAGVQ